MNPTQRTLQPSQVNSESLVTPYPRYGIPLMLMLLGLTIAACWRKIDTSDIFLHLSAGKTIVSTGQIPNRDIFSAASQVGIWVYVEWVWAIALHFAHALGSWSGVNFLTIAAVSFLAVFVLAHCRLRNAGWIEALFCSTLVAVSLLPVLSATPLTMGLTMFAAALVLSDSGRRAPMVLLAPLAALWANVHPGMLLVVVPAIAMLALPPPSIRSKMHSHPRRAFVVIVILASLLALLVHPHSVRLITALWETGVFNLQLAPQRSLQMITNASFLLVLAITFLLAVVAVVARTLQKWEMLCAALLGLATVLFDRSALYFLNILLVAPASSGVTLLLRNWWFRPPIPSLIMTTMVFICTILFLGSLFINRITPDAFGAGIRPRIFPEMAASRLGAIPLRATILNTEADSGYILHRLWPGWKIAIDSRPTLYTPEFRKQYESIWAGNEGWQDLLVLWRVQAILGDMDLTRRHPQYNIYHALAQSSEWMPVYWDRNSIVYLNSKIDISNTNLNRYRQLKPGLPWAEMAARLTTLQQWEEFAADLRLVLSDDPANPVALEFLERAKNALATAK